MTLVGPFQIRSVYDSMEFVVSYADPDCIFFSEVQFSSTAFRKTLFYCAVDYFSTTISEERKNTDKK